MSIGNVQVYEMHSISKVNLYEYAYTEACQYKENFIESVRTAKFEDKFKSEIDLNFSRFITDCVYTPNVQTFDKPRIVSNPQINKVNPIVQAFKEFEHIAVNVVNCEIVTIKQHNNNMNLYAQYLKDLEIWSNDRNSLNNLRVQRKKIPEVMELKRLKRRLVQSKNLLDSANRTIENERLIKLGLKPKYSINVKKLDIEESGHFKKMQIVAAYQELMIKVIPELESDIAQLEYYLSTYSIEYKTLTEQIKTLEIICKSYVNSRAKYLKFFKRFGFNGSKYHCVWECKNIRYQIMLK